MKWIMMLLLAGLAAYSWMGYSKKGAEIESLRAQIDYIENTGDSEEVEKLPELRSNVDGMENEKIFNGILVTFLAAGAAGILFVVFLLPFFANRVTHAVFDSGEKVEKDAMSSARSLVAQGDYEGAIVAFKAAAEEDPMNRVPWVEIVKIHKNQLNDPAAAIETLRYALESHEWEVNDAAYFLFRLAELYDELQGDRASAVAIMHQVVAQFPGTRHSANATHKLHEWEEDGDSNLAAEEAAYLAQIKRSGDE